MIVEKVEQQEMGKMEIIYEGRKPQNRIHRVGTITLGISLILAGILFSVVIGILGGALPAYQDAKLRVVEALR